MAPHIYYRVEDAESGAQYIDGEGIFAGDSDAPVSFNPSGFEVPLLCYYLEQHLDWGNRDPTPFISTYSDQDAAFREANRRVRTGKEDVRIYVIDTYQSDERMEYRDIRRLADKYDVEIPEKAQNNAMFEYIFLHVIPNSAIDKVLKFK